MTSKRAKRRSEADFWAQISIRFPRKFRRPIKFALLRPAPFFEAENRRPREGDSFDRISSPVRVWARLPVVPHLFWWSKGCPDAHTKYIQYLYSTRDEHCGAGPP